MNRAVVAGGGILGTWHALELCRAGFTVDHLEADPAPAGASVRNFGLLWVSGRRAGAELEVAQRSRCRWEDISRRAAGIGFRPNGSLTLARTEGERTVMQSFAQHPDAALRSIVFLEPEAVVALNPAVGGAITGALHCAEDAVVEPRRVLGALREHLERTERYTFHAGRRVVAVDQRSLVDARGARWEADLIVVATGASFDHLAGTDGVAARLRRVRLQMMETAPMASSLTTSVADADSMRYYPAYDVVDRDPLGEQSPVAGAHHLQLLMVQRADGGLTIGDTHAYDEPFDFALSEDPSDELLARAAAVLGQPTPPVTRRWEGVYAQSVDGGVCVREELTSGVWMVTGPGGRGMTCAPGIAADTLAAAGAS